MVTIMRFHISCVYSNCRYTHIVTIRLCLISTQGHLGYRKEQNVGCVCSGNAMTLHGEIKTLYQYWLSAECCFLPWILYRCLLFLVCLNYLVSRISHFNLLIMFILATIGARFRKRCLRIPWDIEILANMLLRQLIKRMSWNTVSKRIWKHWADFLTLRVLVSIPATKWVRKTTIFYSSMCISLLCQSKKAC